MNSSNYSPIDMWNAGCHFVALNYQTHCLEMCLNQGKFRDNGGVWALTALFLALTVMLQCGYVLKPAFMLDPQLSFDPNNPHRCDGHCGVLCDSCVLQVPCSVAGRARAVHPHHQRAVPAEAGVCDCGQG